MIEFTLKDKTYTISKVLVKHYYLLQDIVLLDQTENQFMAISVLSGCPEEDLMTLEKMQFTSLWKAVNAKFFSGVRQDATFRKTIELDKSYTMVDFATLSIGEYMYLDLLHNDPNREKLLHKIMAVLYRPTTPEGKAEEYDSAKTEKYSKHFLELDLEVVHAAIGFFLTIQRVSLSLILSSSQLQNEIPAEKLETFKSLLWESSNYASDGSGSLSSFLERIPYDLKLQAGCLPEQPSITPPTSRTNTTSRDSWLNRLHRGLLDTKEKAAMQRKLHRTQ